MSKKRYSCLPTGKMRFAILAIGAVSLALGIFGCAPTRNAEEIKKAVLEFEPKFKDALARREELDSEIALITEEFRKKQGEVNSKIMELEEELKDTRRQSYLQIRQIKEQLDPERRRITLKLNELKTDLKSKEAMLDTLKNSIRQTDRFVKKNEDSGLPPEENARWHKTLQDLNSKVPPIDDEIAELKEAIYLYRQQLDLLKQ